MWDKIFVKQILTSRNFTPNEINKYIDQDQNLSISIPSFDKLLGILERSNSILIVGDYDVDGIISSCLLYYTLERLYKNKRQIKVFIPNRFVHGYGMNAKTLNFILSNFAGKIDTVITVDNGISSVEEIRVLKENGLRVIIIDHHKFDKTLPNADLIIHPGFGDLGYSYLCASGVALKVCLYLANWIEGNQDLEKLFMFLAGMATIADVVPLLEDNRVIVKRLFKMTREGFVPYVIHKLFSKAYGKDILPYDIFHFSYIIIPRLNSPGRIDNPYLSFKLIYKSLSNQCVMVEKDIEAIEAINRKRQKIQGDVFDLVIDDIEKNKSYQDNIIIPKYIEEKTGLELGVIGIVAGKVCQIYKKPTFIFVRTNGNLLKGSVRNPIEEVDITEIISNYKDIVLKFGGHRKAAGVEIKLEDFQKFRQMLSSTPLKKYRYNVDLSLTPFFWNKFVKYIDDIVKLMEPFGEKNEKPIIRLSNLDLQQIEYLSKLSKDVFVNGLPLIQTLQENYSDTIYLKFTRNTSKGIHFESLSFRESDSRDYHYRAIGEAYLDFFTRGVHFVTASMKSLSSLELLLNSYRDYVLVANYERYCKIKQLVKVKHFALHIPDLKLLAEYVLNAKEDYFITNSNFFRGVLVFCFDFYSYFNGQVYDDNLQRKGIIFVKIEDLL
ncbi:MAG: DHH family phosphoesterase [bacterium]